MDDVTIHFPEVPRPPRARRPGMLLRFAFGASVTLLAGIGMTHAVVAMIEVEPIVAYGVSQAIILAAAIALAGHWMFHGSSVDGGGDVARVFVAQTYFRALDWVIFSVLLFVTDVSIVTGALAGSAVVLPIKFFLYRDAIGVRRAAPSPAATQASEEPAKRKAQRASGA